MNYFSYKRARKKITHETANEMFVNRKVVSPTITKQKGYSTFFKYYVKIKHKIRGLFTLQAY